MPRKEPMTNKEYVACRGHRCPYCWLKEVVAYGRPIEIKCNYCHRRWRETFNLTGYETEEEPENQTDKVAVFVDKALFSTLLKEE